ncbi:MAG: glycosyl transferase group 1 [Segetibacter sp.]|nr:glycosyl transferase group 1 [Segetibacter sp.]
MKKKIAFISEHASPLASLGGVDSGGQNVYVAELSKHLASLGYEIDIYTRWDSRSVQKVVYWKPGIRVVHVKAGPIKVIEKEDLLQYMPAFKDDMVNFIKQNSLNYALVHANFYMSALVASWIKTELSIPFVVTFHALGIVRQIFQGKDDRFPTERIEIEREIALNADTIIAECPQDQDDLIKYYDAPLERVTIIPCGFSASEFYPMDKRSARKFVKLDTNEKILLQLGRMVPRKGVDNVVRALGKLKNSSQKYRLVVVGGETDNPDPLSCPEIARLQKIADEEGVSDKVTFVGRKNRDQLKYYYNASDVFISTPWYEPFGITPLEAMACGTPVIGSNVGGIKYSVVDGKTGYLVPPNDADSLAKKVEGLLTDQNRLEEMQHACIKRVNTYFTWAKVATQVAALYKKIQVPSLVGQQKQPAGAMSKKSKAA